MSKDLLPTTVVIFGASGDLTWRKLGPALFNAFRKKRLPVPTEIVGFAFDELTEESFRQRLREGAEQFAGSFDEQIWNEFAAHLHYRQGNFSEAQDFARLKRTLESLENGLANRLYYLATSPHFFATIVAQLGRLGMEKGAAGSCNVVIEKPFGTDLTSAEALNKVVQAVFKESQIFRIDHYLGKETAQNILFFRFANTIFEPVWNRNYIDHVQITVAEEVDVGHRGGYYDNAGVLRDMFQNHLLQLLALTAMEPPTSFQADAIRDEKVKLLKAVRPLDLDHAVRGQYEGYRDLKNIAEGSQTPTFAALKLYIDNWRWRGVPFYLRSGKRLNTKATEISLVFDKPPHLMFDMPAEELTPNVLSLCIQPDEGIHLKFETKVPDTMQAMQAVDLDFHYRDSFEDVILPDAYERLVLDAIQGDAALFTRRDGIQRSWELLDPVIRAWENDKGIPLAYYEGGTWGPTEADQLLQIDGRRWHHGCTH
ncbi:MAG: glucose-6-phosphate dehydrogenase [Ardenticatenaceae bacterium]|nr:glucose-6-phosphate dehydrogenase [Ardenticatenaceae bacterium]